jgi:fucose 4-O-acetylase-like acetyltransferase
MKEGKFIGHNEAVVLASLVLWPAFTYLNSTVEFYIGDFGNYFFFYIAAFSGIFLFSYIAKLIAKIHCFQLALSEVGQRTLTIFSAHLLIFPFITGFLIYILGLDSTVLKSGVFIAILYSCIAIVFGISLSRLLNRYAPQLVGKSGR